MDAVFLSVVAGFTMLSVLLIVCCGLLEGS